MKKSVRNKMNKKEEVPCNYDMYYEEDIFGNITRIVKPYGYEELNPSLEKINYPTKIIWPVEDIIRIR